MAGSPDLLTHLLEVVQFVILIWAMHAGAAAILSLPIVLVGWKRVHWYYWELLAFILPFAVWWAISSLGHLPKGLGNLIEPMYVSLVVPLGALVRVMGGRGIESDEKVLAAILLGGMCVVSGLVYVVTPQIKGSFG